MEAQTSEPSTEPLGALTLSSTNAARAAAHASRLGLPRISSENAAAYPPPSLNAFRKPEARQPDDSAPALWYWQMAGFDWDRAGHIRTSTDGCGGGRPRSADGHERS